ncbi:hypothetical protein ABKN59_011774 [Abortiporus biennis]
MSIFLAAICAAIWTTSIMLKFSPLTIISLFPLYTWALVGISWNSGNITTFPIGLRDITFPFNIANATHVSGYYYAQQFAFVNALAPSIGYIGIQSRPDRNGKSIIHAVFSSFIAGTTTTDANCHLSADVGPGVSCTVDVPSDYSHTYNMVVENTAGTTWTGIMVDTVTGSKTQVGSWALPSRGIGGIKSSQVGFIEYYPWNDGMNHSCDTLPKTSVFFGVPTTTAFGAIPTLLNGYEYGNCAGEVNFVSSRSQAGVLISIGVV